MKKTKIFLLDLFALSILAILTFFGCASVDSTKGYAETIEEAHPDRFEKTVIGMSLNDFKTVWPEVKRAGVNEDGETYEFIYTHLVYGGYAYDYKIYTYFYFTNNKLIKYESKQAKGL